MSKQFDSQIDGLERQIAALREQMQEVSGYIIDDTAIFAANWFQQQVERAVVSKPERTKELGPEKLRSLKSELKLLIDNVPAITRRYLGDDKLWTHLHEPPDDSSRFSRYTPIDGGFRKALGKILGHVGTLLIKYEFDQLNERSVWEIESHYTTNGYVQELVYRYGIQWSDEVGSGLKRYHDLDKDLVMLQEQLNTVKKEKSESEAKSLWDEA